MKIYIPFKPDNPKTRLSKLLNEAERKNLAYFMLLDVVDACGECTVLSSSQSKLLEGLRYEVDSRDMDSAVTSRIKEGEVAIIMSDLPLINRKIVERFLNTEGDVIIAPGKKGGTNMLLSRSREFYTSYHYGSFFKHMEVCKNLGLSYSVFDSFYASIDVDSEEDLLELMLHGKGKRSREYLEEIGFYVDFSEKDPVLRRIKAP